MKVFALVPRPSLSALLPLALLSMPALAQQQLDPRIAPQALSVLQAQIAFQDAVIKAKTEDESRIATWWAEYVKGLAPSPVVRSK